MMFPVPDLASSICDPSGMLCRSCSLFRTQALFFSAPSPIGRQLLAGWMAGFLVAFIAGSGVAIRRVLVGDWMATAANIAAVTFVPAFALALGIWTGSSKLLEVLYMILWYLGDINKS